MSKVAAAAADKEAADNALAALKNEFKAAAEAAEAAASTAAVCPHFPSLVSSLVLSLYLLLPQRYSSQVLCSNRPRCWSATR